MMEYSRTAAHVLALRTRVVVTTGAVMALMAAIAKVVARLRRCRRLRATAATGLHQRAAQPTTSLTHSFNTIASTVLGTANSLMERNMRAVDAPTS